MLRVALIFLLICSSFYSKAQTVGLVLSGGGAPGMSHIGVIKAFEEHGIPIDYIVGSSAGAIVASLYASGLSPEGMEHVVNSDQYYKMSIGEWEDEHQYYIREESKDASWISFRFDEKLNVLGGLPTNLTNSDLLDIQLVKSYAAVSATAGYNFDSLFIPFRCVASDVEMKESVVFRDGELNEAVRASLSYPGYVRPIRINNRLMFDGGLYNNFPGDVMYEEFLPDVVIGVNLTDSVLPPEDDDVFSQLKSMIMFKTDLSLVCEEGILIEPEVNISTFDFDKSGVAIEDGYQAALSMMDSIKSVIERRVAKSELNAKRMGFFSGFGKVLFDEVVVEGVSANQAKYITGAMLRKNEKVDYDKIKKRYFELLADEKIEWIYPKAHRKENGFYVLKLTCREQDPFQAKFGGVFSSKPINTGYLSLNYMRMGKVGLKLSADSYFGKFYGSVKGSTRMEFNTKIPFYLETFAVLNRWDYFKSFATFFEDVKPSYIVQNERFVGADLAAPVGKFGKIIGSYNYGYTQDDYYQTEVFTAIDTADRTFIDGQVFGLRYEQSSLNRKQYPTEGGAIMMSAKYLSGLENSIPGSTSPLSSPAEDVKHDMLYFKANLERYFDLTHWLKFGGELETSLLLSRENKLLDNYTATIIQSPSFQPFPESRTLFIEDHSSHDYVAAGLKMIVELNSSFSFRGEGYLFQPYNKIKGNAYNMPFYEPGSTDDIQFLSSLGLIYESPLGPAALKLNYYEARDQKWSFIFNFGYVIANRRFFR